MSAPNDRRGAAERAFRVLLALYPRDFRAAFGDDMAAFFRDRRREARRRAGVPGEVHAWLLTLLSILRTAPLERADALSDRLRGARRFVPQRARVAHHPETREDEMLRSIIQDIRYSLRGMRAHPAFSALILATLALGIGANTAIFSVVRGVLLEPLPFAEPDRLMRVGHDDPYSSVSEPELIDYRKDARSFAEIAAYAPGTSTLTGGDAPERVEHVRVTRNFFPTLGVRPLLGRAFTAEEDAPGGPRVAMLSEGLWRRRYGGDPKVVGSDVMVNGAPHTVVGVMPARFSYPAPEVAFWAPLQLDTVKPWTRNNHWLSLVARLAPGASIEGARTELHTLTTRMSRDYPETYFPDKPLVAVVEPVAEQILGNSRPYLLALLGAVGFVLLIACVNVANLLLARGESRRKELAIRTALGASRRRIVRQVLTESLLFAVGGAAIGIVLAWWGGQALLRLAPDSIPRLSEVRIDVTVLAFTTAIALVTGVLFGLVPALRGSRAQSGEALKEGGKTSGQARGLTRARGVLVVSEVALAVVMLTGAGLMLRSLAKLQEIDLGFDPSNVLSLQVALSSRTYSEDQAVAFYERLENRLAAIPGVRTVGAVNDLPISGGSSGWSINLDGTNAPTIAQAAVAMPEHVTPGYFRAMGIPIVKGRAFTSADRKDAPFVAVVSEAMVRRYWPDRDPIGRTIRMYSDSAPWASVVGVAKDVRHGGFESTPPEVMYFPHAQASKSAYYAPLVMTVLVKTAGDPLAIAGAVRAVVAELDRNVPIARLMSMEQVVASSVASRRFSTLLLAGFSALALLLAGIGIYGVISYSVSQRTFEIGLRLALGARGDQVLRQMVWEGVRMAGIGLAIGIAGALAVTRLLRTMLVGVTTTDPATFAVVSALLVAVAVVASWAPARRAMSVDPMHALRAE